MKVVSLTNDIRDNAHFVTIGCVSDEFLGEPEVLESQEITEWKWFDLDRLPSPIYFITEKVIKNYKEKTIYRNESKSL